MPQFLSKHDISLQAPKAPVNAENLASDLLGIMDTSTKALNTYNTIGATAAKTQAQEDARQYHSYIAEINASLADKQNDPKAWTAARDAIHTLSAEWVAKSDTFKNHDAAYDAYAGIALDHTTEVKSNFEPKFYNGYADSETRQWKIKNEDEARLSAATPSGQSIISMQQGAALRNEDIGDSESSYSKYNLSFIDEDMMSQEGIVLLNRISTGNKIDHTKATQYLNSLTGSAVKYIYNAKDKKISLVTPLQSDIVKEQYMARYSKLESMFSDSSNYHNVDYDVATNNYKAPTVSTDNKNYELALHNTTTLNQFRKSAGYSQQTPSQQKVTVDNIVTNTNFIRMTDSLSAQLQRGENLFDSSYNPAQSFNNNGSIDIRDAIDINGASATLSVSSSEVDAYVGANVKDIKSKASAGEAINEKVFQAIAKTKPDLISDFTDHIQKQASGLEDMRSEHEVINRVTWLKNLGDPQYGINAFDAEAMNNIAGEMEIMIDGARTASKGKDEKEALKIMEGALKKATSAYKSLPIQLSNIKVFKDRDLENLNKLVDIDGLFNNTDIDSQTAANIRMLIKTPNNPNPTTKQVAQAFSDHAFNTDAWFSWDNTEKILFEVKDDNGNYVGKDIMRKGLDKWADERGLVLSDFDVYNGVSLGNNTALVMRNKKTGEVVDRLTGRYFNILMSDEINNARKNNADIAKSDKIKSRQRVKRGIMYDAFNLK